MHANDSVNANISAAPLNPPYVTGLYDNTAVNTAPMTPRISQNIPAAEDIFSNQLFL